MTSKPIVFLCLATLLLGGCKKREENDFLKELPDASAKAAPAAPRMREVALQAEAPPQRYIALTHTLQIDSSAAKLPQVFEDTLKRCEQAGCDILSSSLQRETEYAGPSATLSARLPPKAVETFLTGFGEDAEVVQHGRDAEDKTDEVIDADARIRNLTELRDRLRAMQSAHTGSIKDVLEIQRQLTETQSQLDTIHGTRKALANQTEKVAVNIQFHARTSVAERSFFAPVTTAWNEAGQVLMSSVGGLITFVAAVLPWLLIAIPAGYGLRLLWRKVRSRKQALARQ